MGQILRLDSSGHGVVAKWNTAKADITEAGKVFAELQGQNFTMFKTDGGDGDTVKLKSFDPDAQTIIAVPRLVGG